MTTYYYSGEVTPAGTPHRPAGQVMYYREVNIPDLIANGGLVDANGNALAVPSTGFSDEDILKVFAVPAGTLIRNVAVKVTTAEGGTCTCKIGCQTAAQIHTAADDDDGWMAAVDLNSAGYDITAHDDGFGTDNFGGILYITDGYIDLEFNTDLTAVAVFEIAVDAVEMFPSS